MDLGFVEKIGKYEVSVLGDIAIGHKRFQLLVQLLRFQLYLFEPFRASSLKYYTPAHCWDVAWQYPGLYRRVVEECRGSVLPSAVANIQPFEHEASQKRLDCSERS